MGCCTNTQNERSKSAHAVVPFRLKLALILLFDRKMLKKERSMSARLLQGCGRGLSYKSILDPLLARPGAQDAAAEGGP